MTHRCAVASVTYHTELKRGKGDLCLLHANYTEVYHADQILCGWCEAI